MSLVVQKHDHVRLMIAGGSRATDCDDVPALLSEFGLSEKATYLGVLPVKEVIDLLASADILVAPKLDHPVNHAGFSQKLAEYLSMGKPVVVSRVGDVSLYLQHGVHAMLCEPGNVRDLAANISLLLSDEELAAQISKQSRVLAEEAFDASINVANVIEMLGKSSSAKLRQFRNLKK